MSWVFVALRYVGSEAVGVGAGMIRFLDARIHAAAHVLAERAEETVTDRSGDEAGIEDYVSGRHFFFYPSGVERRLRFRLACLHVHTAESGGRSTAISLSE